MAIVVKRTDPMTFYTSAHTPDFPDTEWLHNPSSFSALFGAVPSKYWKVVGDDIVEMETAEKQDVDDRLLAAKTAVERLAAKEELQNRVFRAFATIVLQELNTLRDEHGLTPRTMQQLRAALENEVDNG